METTALCSEQELITTVALTRPDSLFNFESHIILTQTESLFDYFLLNFQHKVIFYWILKPVE